MSRAQRMTGMLVFLASIGCSPMPGPDKSIAGGILGAGWGAGAGAVIGNQLNQTGPGAAIGSGLGAASGLVAGIGLDVAEGGELETRRDLDAMKVMVMSNQESLERVQHDLDQRDSQLPRTVGTEVFFDEGRASLRSGSAAMLQRFAQSIKANPYVGRIAIHGHSDEMGDADTNYKISEARARTVATFLVNQGISSDEIDIIPHGTQMPLASNTSESGRQLNRRVEVVLLR